MVAGRQKTEVKVYRISHNGIAMAGSIVVVFHILFFPLTQRYFSLVWRYRILKTALFFYLIPVGGCKYYVFGILQTMFPNLWNRIYKLPKFNAAYSISAEGGIIRLSPDVYKIVFILLMSGMIASFIFSDQSFKIKDWGNCIQLA